MGHPDKRQQMEFGNFNLKSFHSVYNPLSNIGDVEDIKGSIHLDRIP